MLIQELILNNFRVYAGEHRFDLAPRKKYGKFRPIILFGGLNGAGKTSILSGLRLALYGRDTLGQGTSQKRYNDFLVESIHHSRETNRAPSSASVKLRFSYAKLGTEHQIKVERSWERAGSAVKERLKVFENDKAIQGLNYEQAQSFLNELIPIGVSDLFFFDGEKIAELAEDTRGSALEQSVKKLLGLDVVERLAGDLTVLNRNITKVGSELSIQKSIDSLQELIKGHRHTIEKHRQSITTSSIQHAEVSLRIKQLSKSITERGGHFSANRKDLEQKLDALHESRLEIITETSRLISDASPLALADQFCKRLEIQILSDAQAGQILLSRAETKRALTSIERSLKKKLDRSIFKIVATEFENLSKSWDSEITGHQIVHDLTTEQASRILLTLKQSQDQKLRIQNLFSNLNKVESQIEEVQASLARAPDDELIQSDFESLQIAQRQLGKLDAEIAELKSLARNKAKEAVDAARQLDKLYEIAAKSSDQQRVIGYIGNVNGLLKDFITQTAEVKIRDLEQQFTQCFARLARKGDLAVMLKVDPKTFKVQLISNDGRVLAKDELSAGERQIFAISVLEALAKTSGRQLPMIVDTPLGRLDSKHRSKLIEGYFPKASHQMIILSTDTEVDESFYKELSPDISRAYKLEYDSKTGSTHVEEGYFWQMQKAG